MGASKALDDPRITIKPCRTLPLSACQMPRVLVKPHAERGCAPTDLCGQSPKTYLLARMRPQMRLTNSLPNVGAEAVADRKPACCEAPGPNDRTRQPADERPWSLIGGAFSPRVIRRSGRRVRGLVKAGHQVWPTTDGIVGRFEPVAFTSATLIWKCDSSEQATGRDRGHRREVRS